MRFKAICRIAAVAALALPLVPLQWLAVRLDWRLARSLPVFFHRCVLAVIGVKLDVRGRQVSQRPLLIVANHVSWLDIVVLGAAAPLSFIAKSEVSGWPVIGLFSRLQRSVFIERERRHKTGDATAEIGERLRRGDAMVLFGEGTTGDGVHILPFRSALLGAAREALGEKGANVLVQPLAVSYVRRGGLPIGRGAMKDVAWIGDTDLAPHLLGILSGPPLDVVVSWGDAIAYEGATNRKLLARRLEKEVRRLARVN